MELKTFAPDLEKLGYKYISLSIEETEFLKTYGGVFYKWSHKHDPNLTPMSICSCGMKSPYVVNQCIFCGNKNFRQQLSPNRKMKKENIDRTIVEEVPVTQSEIRLYNLSFKFKLNVALYETMFNFITDELYRKGENSIFYIGLIEENSEGFKELIIFNENYELIPIAEFMKRMKFNRNSDAGKFIITQLESIYDGDIDFYNIGFHNHPSNYTHDQLQKEINETLFKDSTYLTHTFMTYLNDNAENYNRNNYDFSKKKNEFFKISKESLNYLISLNKKKNSYGIGLLTNENILKLQKMGEFINKKLFIKYPQLELVSFETIYDLYKIISNNKTKEKHTLDEVISYFDYLNQNEALTFEIAIALYAGYLRKVKKSDVEMYVKELKLKNTLI